MTESIHIRAVDWALDKGYVISVQDYCCEADEWDCEYSRDRAKILEAIDGTELPNVYILEPFIEHKTRISGDKTKKIIQSNYRHITTFSVIDEGTPSETINDFSCGPNSGEFDQWISDAWKDYE
jgi:hypothetical protein